MKSLQAFNNPEHPNKEISKMCTKPWHTQNIYAIDYMHNAMVFSEHWSTMQISWYVHFSTLSDIITVLCYRQSTILPWKPPTLH